MTDQVNSGEPPNEAAIYEVNRISDMVLRLVYFHNELEYQLHDLIAVVFQVYAMFPRYVQSANYSLLLQVLFKLQLVEQWRLMIYYLERSLSEDEADNTSFVITDKTIEYLALVEEYVGQEFYSQLRLSLPQEGIEYLQYLISYRKHDQWH